MMAVSFYWQIDWLIDLLFYVPLKNFSLIWRRHHCQWRAAKLRPMLGTQGLWAGRDLYRATPTVTRDLGFSGLIRRTAPFSRLLRHAWGFGGPILTWILTGLIGRRENQDALHNVFQVGEKHHGPSAMYKVHHLWEVSSLLALFFKACLHDANSCMKLVPCNFCSILFPY
jgi:hypothetical protein